MAPRRRWFLVALVQVQDGLLKRAWPAIFSTYLGAAGTSSARAGLRSSSCEQWTMFA